MQHDDDQGQGRVAIPLFLSVFFIIFILSVVRSCQGADTVAITAPLEAAKIELTTKLKTARAKLIDGLKREEKAAQAAGKLDLTLAIRARLAELESLLGQNPFEKTETIESAPVEGSMAEKLYLAETTAASTVLAKKIEAGLAQLEAKKIAATKTGRIDEALSYDDVILAWKETFDGVSKFIPMEKKGWATLEVTEGMSYEVGTLLNGQTTHSSNHYPLSEVPDEIKGLKFNKMFNGRGSSVTIRVLTPGKMLFLIQNDHPNQKEYGEQIVKQFGGKVEAFTVKTSIQNFTIWSATHLAGKVFKFAQPIIVAGAIVELKKLR